MLSRPRGRMKKAASSGPRGLAEIAADLEQGLGEAVFAARGDAGDARGFRVKDRGADAEQGGGGEEFGVGRREGEADEAREGEAHAEGQGEGLGFRIGIEADDGLEDRGGDLIDQGDQADLGEVEVKAAFEQRVDRGQEHLHHVVQHVADADGDQHGEGGARCGAGRRFEDGAHGMVSPWRTGIGEFGIFRIFVLRNEAMLTRFPWLLHPFMSVLPPPPPAICMRGMRGRRWSIFCSRGGVVGG
jgi:hypothetical protein